MVADIKMVLLCDKRHQHLEECAADCTFGIDGGSRFFHDVGSYLPDCMASHAKIL
jgi:hypothetical protein